MVTRNSIRAALCALALGCLSLAHAQAPATYPVGADDFKTLRVRPAGPNSAKVSVGSVGGATGTRIASTPMQMLEGATGVRNFMTYSAGASPGGLRAGMAGEAFIVGTKVPVNVVTPISKLALADGMGILFRNSAKLAGPVGIVMALAEFADMLDRAGIKQNPNAANEPDKPFMSSVSMLNCDMSAAPQRVTDPQAWCSAVLSGAAGVSGTAGLKSVTSVCTFQTTCTQTGVVVGVYESTVALVLGGGREEPAGWDTVRPKFLEMAELPSDVLQRQIDWARKQEGQNGIEPYKIDVGAPVVTTPSPTLQPEVKTEKTTRTVIGADGRPTTVETTTTTTTTRDVSVVGDTITVNPKTETTTTTKTTSPDGLVTENTTTDRTETVVDKDPSQTEQPPQPDLCEKNPDILACAKPDLDTPDGEIDREEREVTYEAEDLFGTGSCPANLQTNLITLNQMVTVWDWQKTCEMALPLRALVLALASFAAFLIVMPGETRA